MKTLVIFDLDGTLLNTLDDLAAAANHALAEQELPVHPVEQYKTFVGDGVYKLIERMTPPAQRADTALAARLKEGFDRYYAAHGEELTAPYPGVLDTLDALRERGVICAVLSNKPHEFSVLRLGIRQFEQLGHQPAVGLAGIPLPLPMDEPEPVAEKPLTERD